MAVLDELPPLPPRLPPPLAVPAKLLLPPLLLLLLPFAAFLLALLSLLSATVAVEPIFADPSAGLVQRDEVLLSLFSAGDMSLLFDDDDATTYGNAA